MAISHRCTEFAYDVSCIIGTYLNASMKASSTASMSDPGGRILVSFQYLRDKLSHGRYVGRPLSTSLQTLLLTRDSERAAAARRVQEPAPSPTIGGLVVLVPGVGQSGDGGSSPPVQCWWGADGNPFTNLRPIQRLLLGENICGI